MSFVISYAFGGMANVRHVQDCLLKALGENNGKDEGRKIAIKA